MSTLTNLIPDIYESLDIVSREMVGFIPAVAHNTSAERAALNETIRIPTTDVGTEADNTAAVTPPDTGDQTIGNVTMTISKSKHIPFRWTGEEQRGLLNAGTYGGILKNQFVQAFRRLGNLVEIDLYDTARKGASRAYGTAATTPFGTTGVLTDVAELRRILEDNGAPQGDLQLVLGSAAVAKLRGIQQILLKVNEAGSAGLLRRGSISDVPLEGFALHNSNAVGVVTKGTGASYVTSGSTAAGVGSIALITGTGTVLAGDVVGFAADTANKYVVNTGVTAAGTIVIGAPGAKVVIADANALTVGGSYTPNVGFDRNALQLITRAPANPTGPNGESMDMAEDMMLITDPITGITYEISVYKGFRRMTFHVALAWGTAAIKPAHIATLIG